MSKLHFKQLFWGLMALSLVCAFFVPERFTNSGRVQIQNLFFPVAWPARRIGAVVRGKVDPPKTVDPGSPSNPRPNSEVFEENERLRVLVASLSGQVQRLQQREAERDVLGDVRDLCTRFRSFAADPGTRQVLMLNASTFDALREGMPVLTTNGIVGRVWRVSAMGSQVMLITDKQSRMTAVFARYIRQPDGRLSFVQVPGEPVLVKGAGEGMMVIENVPGNRLTDTDIRLDDWVVLSDSDWPIALNSYRIGVVSGILPSHPGFFNVQIRPSQPLSRLLEVLVMNKEKG